MRDDIYMRSCCDGKLDLNLLRFKDLAVSNQFEVRVSGWAMPCVLYIFFKLNAILNVCCIHASSGGECNGYAEEFVRSCRCVYLAVMMSVCACFFVILSQSHSAYSHLNSMLLVRYLHARSSSAPLNSHHFSTFLKKSLFCCWCCARRRPI